MKKLRFKVILKKIVKNEPISVRLRFTIPFKILIPAVLIMMALTGKFGAFLAMGIAVFMIFIILIPDNF